jgi:WD40 repeat protein
MAPEQVPAPRHPRVFVSYAHDSAVHKRVVFELEDLLRANGIETVIDRQPAERINWNDWMTTEILQADFVLLIASPAYRAAVERTSSSNHFGVQAEGRLLRDRYHGDPETWRTKILPVVLPGCRVEDIPLFVSPNIETRYEIADLTREGAAELLAVLTGQRLHTPRPLGELPATLTSGMAGRARPDDHWLRSVRGSDTRSSDVFFTGRTGELERLAGFARAAEPGLCVVTGMPGAGKSAVLSVLLLRSRWPRLLPEQLLSTVPDAGIAVAVHASGKSVDTIVAEIAQAVGAPGGPLVQAREVLFEWLESDTSPLVVVIDAVDEATQPVEVAILAYELSGRVPLLIGVRPAGPRRSDGSVPLPGPLRTSKVVLDLDGDAAGTVRDISKYVARRLRVDPRQPGGYGVAQAWPERVLIDVIGAEVAERVADRNFLVAQFVVQELLETPVLTGIHEGWSSAMNWPGNLDGWMERDLVRRYPDDAARARARALLVPLAFALRGGLTSRLWQDTAAALTGSTVTTADLNQLMGGLGFFVAEVGAQPQRFSFRHEAFAAHFRGGSVDWAGDDVFVDALLDSVPKRDRQRVWSQASEYARLNLFAHARRARRLEPLLIEEPLSLAAADMYEALQALADMGNGRAGEAGSVLRRASYASSAGFGDRAAALQFHAALSGSSRLARNFDALRDDLPWSTLWTGGAMAKAAYAIGASRTTREFVPIRGGGAEPPAALVLRPNGLCRLEDAVTGVPLGPEIRVYGASDEPPEVFVGWQGADGTVYAVAADPTRGPVIQVISRLAETSRPPRALRVAGNVTGLVPIVGPRGLDLLAVLAGDRLSTLTVHALRAPDADTSVIGAVSANRVFPLIPSLDVAGFLATTPDRGLLVCRLLGDDQPTFSRFDGLPGSPVAAVGDADRACVLLDDGDRLRVLWLHDSLSGRTVGADLLGGDRATKVALHGDGSAALAVTGDGQGHLVAFQLKPTASPVRLTENDIGTAVRELAFLDAEPPLVAAADLAGAVHISDPEVAGPAAAMVQHGEPMARLLPLRRNDDGPLLATRAAGGLTKVWQIDTGLVRSAAQTAPTRPVRQVAWSPVGTAVTLDLVVAATGELPSAQGWFVDTATRRTHEVAFPHGENVNQVAAIPVADAAIVCTAGDEEIRLWMVDPAGLPKPKVRWSTEGRMVESLAAIPGPGGIPIVVAAGPETLQIRPAAAEAAALVSLADEPVVDIAWCRWPNGHVVIAAGSDDGLVRVLSLGADGGSNLRTLKHGKGVASVAVLASGSGVDSIAAVDRHGELCVWKLAADVEAPVLRTRLLWLVTELTAVQGPRSTLLATAEQGGSILLWDITSGEPRLDWKIDPIGGRPHHLLVDGSTLAFAATSGAVLVANVSSRRTSVLRLNCDLTTLSLIRGGGRLLGSYDCAVFVLDPWATNSPS